jgi:hypothetical protein
MEQDSGILTIGECYVHLHDASNYAREALASRHGGIENVVTTHTSDGALWIVVRRRGSVDGYTARVPFMGDHTDRVKPKHLNLAVERLKASIEK